MNTGFIKFVHQKGYGFITVSTRPTNLFFHINDIMEGEKVGQNDYVTFDIEETKKGDKAVNIRKL